MPLPPKIRRYDLDAMKGILVVGMILDHAVILLADKPARAAADELKIVLGLASFPGFLFCFGYAAWLSYFARPAPFQRLLPSITRPLAAYYISAYFYLLFVERAYGASDLLQVLYIGRLVPYAEFLLSFAVILALAYLLRKPIGYILERPRLLAFTLGALLLATFLPNGWVRVPILAVFIGLPESVAAAFPVLQYFPFFLLGMTFARYEIKPSPLIGLAGIAAFYLFTAFIGDAIRFPPNLPYILGGLFFVLTWYAASRFLSRFHAANRLLVPVGANALFYLVAAHIQIFAFRGALPKLGGAMNLKTTLETTLAIFAVCYFLAQIVRVVEVKNDSPAAPSESA